MRGVRQTGGIALGCGLLIGLAVGGLGYARRVTAASDLSPVTWVYTPPRQLYLNFWVPGAYSNKAFVLKVNGQAVAFNVADESTLSVQSVLPFGAGQYTMTGTLSLPHEAGAVFPASATFDVVNRADTARWRPAGIDQSTAIGLDAINAWRRASGEAAVVWSSSLQLAADHHRAYRAAHPKGNQSLSTETPGLTDFTGGTPMARATLAGYLGSAVGEWDGPEVARDPLAVVAQMMHGVFDRFFLMDPSMVRIGLAIDPEGTPVIDGGLTEPSPLMAKILTDPGPGAKDVPTAWDDREDPRPWPQGPVLTGYPIAVMLEGWNLTGPFSIDLSNAHGAEVPSELVTNPDDPAMAAIIPKIPLQPGETYRVSVAVNASDPLTATSVLKTLSGRFRTAPAGLTLSPINQSSGVAVGHTAWVQLSALSASGRPLDVGQSVHWRVGPGLSLVAGTQMISPSGLAEALVLARSGTHTAITATIGKTVIREALVTHGPADRPGVAIVPGSRFTGTSRLAIVAAIAEATARASQTAPREAILLAQNPAASVDTLLFQPLAHAFNAPVLLTESGSRLGRSTRSALIAMHIRQVFLVGATGTLRRSLPPGVRVVGQLPAEGPVRLAVDVARELILSGHPYHQVMVIENQPQDWADGLSVGPVAARLDLPMVLVTKSGQVPAMERPMLTPVTQSFVIGSAAKLSPAVPDAMDLAGNNRYDTALLVDHEFFSNGLSGVILTSALPGHLVPAFAAVDLAALLRVPVVFSAGATLTVPTESWLAQVHWATAPKVEVVGAVSAVPKAVVAMVRGLVES